MVLWYNQGFIATPGTGGTLVHMYQCTIFDYCANVTVPLSHAGQWDKMNDKHCSV